MAVHKYRGKILFIPAGVQIGANGQRLAEIMSGSVGGCYLAVNASAATAASFSVTGISASHKIFANVYSGNDTCNLVLTRLVPTANTITASVGNWVGTDISAAGSLVIHYVAIKDK